MAKSNFTMTLEVEFANSRVNTNDELPTEMGNVSHAVESALKGRLSKGYQGSVIVSITAAKVEETP